jgi:hypothetical protein
VLVPATRGRWVETSQRSNRRDHACRQQTHIEPLSLAQHSDPTNSWRSLRLADRRRFEHRRGPKPAYLIRRESTARNNGQAAVLFTGGAPAVVMAHSVRRTTHTDN